MRKLIGIVTGLFSLMLIMSACSGDSKDGYLLRMRLAKGDTFLNNINMDMDMAISMMGTQQKMKMGMDLGSRFEVLDSNDAGQQLKMTYTSMKMKMEMGLAPGVNTDSILNETTKPVVGKSIIITLKDKKVTNVSGMDSIMVSQDSASGKMVEKMFAPDNLNKTFGIMFTAYPDRRVKPGDSWSSDNEMEMGMMKMMVKTTYTLAGVKDGIAELTINGSIDSKGTMNQGGMDMNIDMKGKQKGRMYIKLETGYINKGNYDMEIVATMDAMGQKIPMTINSKYSITGNQ